MTRRRVLSKAGEDRSAAPPSTSESLVSPDEYHHRLLAEGTARVDEMVPRVVEVLVATPALAGLDQARARVSEAVAAVVHVYLVAMGERRSINGAETAEVERSQRQATALATAGLEVATRLGLSGVVRPEELAVEQAVLALGSLEAHRVWNPAVDRLLAIPVETRARLLHTLDALWESGGNRLQAAKGLGLSDRSVRRHLVELREHTGFDPDDPAQRWSLDMARHAITLFGAEPMRRERRLPEPG
jgi:hypothetical protein